MSDDKNNPFDPKHLRITGDLSDLIIDEAVLRIPVKKPNNQEFFRVHTGPEHQLTCAIVELKEEREIYLIPPKVCALLEDVIRHVQIRVCQTRQGTVFLWPVPMPTSDGRTNSWHQSARDAASIAEHSWVRMSANMPEGCYSVFKAIGNLPEPKWPEKTLLELLELGFKDGKLVDSPEHPLIQRLQGA